MGVIQVIADRPGAGKTCLAGALLTRLAREGRKAGYYKPLSAAPGRDSDTFFVTRTVLSGVDSVPLPSPQQQPAAPGESLSPGAISAMSEEVARLEAGVDVVLVEGPDLAPAGGLAAQLADGFSARVLLVFGYAKGLSATSVADAAGPFGDRLAGVVVNNVPLYRRRDVDREILDALRSRGVPTLGALPEDRAMLAVTVQQISETLGGRYVEEPEDTGVCIDRFLIGGNTMDSGTNYFGRYPRQAVIVRGQRPDIQLVSLMMDTRCLILTEGDEPSEYVRVEARNREVPLILVEQDTLTTAEKLGGLLAQANPYSMSKVERFEQLTRERLDGAALAAILG